MYILASEFFLKRRKIHVRNLFCVWGIFRVLYFRNKSDYY